MTGTAGALRTPDWLLRGEIGLGRFDRSGQRRRRSFVEKTLEGVSEVMRQAMFSEDVARRQGLLQRIDPRAKVVVALALLLATGLVHHIPVLLGMYAVTLVLAGASGLAIGFFIKRVWLFIPIFTGIIVLPATFSFITPGEVLLPLWSWHGHAVGITEQGLETAGLLVMRVATSVSLVVLVTLTTPWAKLLAGLRALLVPRLFVLIIGMAYRYVFLLLDSVADMYTAREARAVGNARDTKRDRRVLAATAGALFGKAHALSEEVHMAMTSRGFRGDAKTLGGLRIAGLDVAFALSGAALAALALGGDRLIGR